MNSRLALCLFCTLFSSINFAGPIKIISKPENQPKVAAGIEVLLGKPYSQPAETGVEETAAFYQTFPLSSFLNLTDKGSSNFVQTTTDAVQDSNTIIMTNYISLHKDKVNAAESASDLGLRMLIAPGADRASASQQLAESNLVQTGDVIVSVRPKFSQSLRYLTLQLLSTHVSVAVVTNESGKKVVYNIDMPMDADMLAGKLGHGFSKLDSNHFTADIENLSLHILRPRLTAVQKQNMQGWLELALKRAREKSIYPAKISFNTNYESPLYRSPQDLTFVADLGRLMLASPIAKPTQHLQMYCSEFAWSMLSLRDCNPSSVQDFSKTQPSCVKSFFTPMVMFGSSFSSGKAGDQSDFIGMTDGVMLLASQTGNEPNMIGKLIDQAIPASADLMATAPGLSNGHRDVAKLMTPLINQANAYFKLVTNENKLPNEVLAQHIDGYRAKLNPNSMRNYSPTAFVVHALMPSTIGGVPVTQKALDYVATIKYVSDKLNKDNVQKIRTTPNL